jgi:hypothetical protein
MNFEGPITEADEVWSSHLRISGRVVRDSRWRSPRSLWFSIPRDLEPDWNRRGDPWLLLLLPFAMALGEPLRIPLPVDPTLLANVAKLQSLWSAWQPHRLKIIPVEAEPAPPTEPSLKRRSVSFFSGGIDSYYTALHRDRPTITDPGEAPALAHELVFILAFERALRPQFVPKKLETLRRAAEAIGDPIHILATNLRELRLADLDWGGVLHGFALGAIGQLLSPRYARVLIPSSHSPPHDFPWGSHPDSDPLFSSKWTEFVHHGGEVSRFDKTRILSDNEHVLNAVHVCLHGQECDNCSRCGKCLRTMAALDLLGRLQQARAFDASAYHVDRLRRLQISTASGASFAHELMRAAEQRNRTDMLAALQDALEWNSRNQRVVAALGRLERFAGLGAVSRSLQRKISRRLWARAVK